MVLRLDLGPELLGGFTLQRDGVFGWRRFLLCALLLGGHRRDLRLGIVRDRVFGTTARQGDRLHRFDAYGRASGVRVAESLAMPVDPGVNPQPGDQRDVQSQRSHEGLAERIVLIEDIRVHYFLRSSGFVTHDCFSLASSRALITWAISRHVNSLSART